MPAEREPLTTPLEGPAVLGGQSGPGWAVCDSAREPARVPDLSWNLHGGGKDPPFPGCKSSLSVMLAAASALKVSLTAAVPKPLAKFHLKLLARARDKPPTRVCRCESLRNGSRRSPRASTSNTGPSQPLPTNPAPPPPSRRPERPPAPSPGRHQAPPPARTPRTPTTEVQEQGARRGRPRPVPQAPVSLSRAQRPLSSPNAALGVDTHHRCSHLSPDDPGPRGDLLPVSSARWGQGPG